jgi:hypothetical protein
MRLEFASSGTSPTFVVALTFGTADYLVEGMPLGEVRAVAAGENVADAVRAR